MISAGKISAEDMNKVLIDMGKKYQNATQNFTSTIPGLKRTIDATMPQLISAIEQPFYKMKNPILGSLSKAVTDPAIKSEVGKLGKILSDALNDVMNAFGGGASFNGVKVLKGILQDVEGAVKKTATTLVEHKNDIKSFMSVMSQASVATWKVFAETLKILEPAISAVSKAAAAHPKAFGVMATGMIAMNAASKALRNPLMLVAGSLLKLHDNAGKAKDKLGGLKSLFGTLKDKIAPLTGKIKDLAMTFGSKLLSGLKKVLPIGKNVLGMFKSIGTFFLTNPFGIAITAIVAIGTALTELYKHNAKFRKFVNGIISSVKDWVGNTASKIKKWGSDVGKSIGNACAVMKSKMSDGWKRMKQTVSDGVTAITDKDSKLHDEMISKISDATGVSKKTLNSAYSTMEDYTGTWHDIMTGKWGKVKDDVVKVGNDLASTAKSLFSDLYNKLNDLTGGGLDKIKQGWDKLWTNVIDGIKSAARSVGNHVADMVNNVIKPINDMLGGVKDGVNWVLDKFGASKWSGFKIPLVHFANGGIVGDGTMAMVNDSGKKHYREMFATPDGRIGAFPKQRNLITYLPKGTQVLDGENSKMLAEMMGIPAFKGGTKDKNLFEKIFDKGKDIFEDITDIISHPIKFMEKVLTKYLHVNTGIKFASTLISHAPTFFAKQAENWLKKMAEDWKKKQEESSVGGFGKIPEVVDGQNLRDLVKKALEANGLSTSDDMIAKVMRQIATESGGNAHAVQPGADPDGDGSGPALGLMQTKRSTFNAYKAPGHDDIFNAYDNLLAALNYAKHRYGPSLYFLGQGHGYANGGFINKQQLAMIGEQNKPEVVIPLSQEKQGRALDLLTATVNKLNHNAGRNTVVTNNPRNDNSGLERKLDTMIGLLSNILGVNQAQLNKSNKTGLTTLYQEMSRNQSLNDYQAF